MVEVHWYQKKKLKERREEKRKKCDFCFNGPMKKAKHKNFNAQKLSIHKEHMRSSSTFNSHSVFILAKQTNRYTDVESRESTLCVNMGACALQRSRSPIRERRNTTHTKNKNCSSVTTTKSQIKIILNEMAINSYLYFMYIACTTFALFGRINMRMSQCTNEYVLVPGRLMHCFDFRPNKIKPKPNRTETVVCCYNHVSLLYASWKWMEFSLKFTTVNVNGIMLLITFGLYAPAPLPPTSPAQLVSRLNHNWYHLFALNGSIGLYNFIDPKPCMD